MSAHYEKLAHYEKIGALQKYMTHYKKNWYPKPANWYPKPQTRTTVIAVLSRTVSYYPSLNLGDTPVVELSIESLVEM